MNTSEILKRREHALDAVRSFFKNHAFTEVETPLLVPSPGLEPHLDPFEVRHVPRKRETVHTSTLYLHTSPEYAMKKLLAAGSGNIFQICKAFRDEPTNEHHLPEFTILEWYRLGAGPDGVMDDCERLCAAVAHALCGQTAVEWHGSTLSLEPPYQRISVREAFRKYARTELTFGESLDQLRTLARRSGCTDLAPDDDWDDVFFKMFLRHVEPQLGRNQLPIADCGLRNEENKPRINADFADNKRTKYLRSSAFICGQNEESEIDRPTFLHDYPARMAALSRIKPGDPLVCERFELYAGGLELANAFAELTDPVEQRRRFEADNAKRRELGRPQLPIDEEFLAALERGLPDCAGVALGLDRLIMLLTDTADIRHVVPLPPAREHTETLSETHQHEHG